MVALLRAGVPLGPVLTFFVVSPVLSFPTFAVMASMFSVRLALIYAGVAVTGGVVAAYLLERVLGVGGALRLTASTRQEEPCTCQEAVEPEQSSCCSGPPEEACCASGHGHSHSSCCSGDIQETPRSPRALLRQAWIPTRDTLVTILPYSLVAMVLAASLRTWLPMEAVSDILARGGSWGVLGAALAGIPLYVGCTTAVSLATPLMQATGAIGPGVAFIIAGAGTSINGLVFMAAIFTRRFIALFVAAVFIIAVLCGLILTVVPWG